MSLGHIHGRHLIVTATEVCAEQHIKHPRRLAGTACCAFEPRVVSRSVLTAFGEFRHPQLWCCAVL